MRVFPSRTVQIEAIEEPGVARSFDRVTGIPQFRLGLHLFMVKALSNLAGGRAIDIGCGGGRLAISLAKLYPFAEVVGLDLSDEMLELARKRVARTALGDRVTFRKGNAERIPYAEKSFDLVVSTLSLHHWLRPERVLDEVARVLRPGGKCVLLDMRRDPIPLFTGLLWFVQHFIVPDSLRKAGEPLGSLQSSYTRQEASAILAKSRLGAFCRASTGPFYLVIKGRKK